MRLNTAAAALRIVSELLSTVGAIVPVDGSDEAADLAFVGPDGSRIDVQIKSYTSVRPSDHRLLGRLPNGSVIRVIVAPRISDAAASTLEAAGLSWVALDGPAHITAPGINIRVLRRPQEDADPPVELKQPFTWTPVKRDVAEYLLTRVPRLPTASTPMPRTEDVGQAIGHSQPAAAKAMQGLASRGWLRKEGPERGRGSHWSLVEPTALLDDWTADRPSQTGIRVHGLIGSQMDFVHSRLASRAPKGQWCLAGTSASELLSPLLTASPVLEVALSQKLTLDLRQLLDDLDLRVVEGGHRIRFVTLPTVCFNTLAYVDEIPVTSPVRTYADVHDLPGRGPEIASNIRQAHLGY